MTTQQPQMTEMVWIDVMGIEPCLIEAHLIGERVMVDAETIERMAHALLSAGLFDDETERDMVREVRSTPLDTATGLYDVTEVGGGWDRWAEMIVE